MPETLFVNGTILTMDESRGLYAEALLVRDGRIAAVGPRAQVEAQPAIRILAESEKAGLFLMSTDSGRQIFVTGHPEYDKMTLDSEYRRDLEKGLPIRPPENYYENDDPNGRVLFRWRSHAHLLYSNWLNYYVYQDTPYDLNQLPQWE